MKKRVVLKAERTALFYISKILFSDCHRETVNSPYKPTDHIFYFFKTSSGRVKIRIKIPLTKIGLSTRPIFLCQQNSVRANDGDILQSSISELISCPPLGAVLETFWLLSGHKKQRTFIMLSR